MSRESSYNQILKASSVMGGAAGINLLLGMVRVKFAAILIGATGVGLNASFGAVQGVVGTVAGLGIQSSAVREVAVAVGKGDQEAIGRAVLTLRRLCWLTGLIGMLAMMAFSPFLSQLTFDSDAYTLDIAALGIIILFANLAGGQLALLQGMRRIGDMARVNVIGAILGTISAICFYTALGLRGIVPTLIAVSGIQLALSWFYARKVPVPAVQLSLAQTLHEASGMARLGMAFMWSGLMGSAVSYITVMLITQHAGLQAVGIYSAAFALSGMFVNFVLGAMGSDYYPRLTAVIRDKKLANQMINEQLEIGLLIAVPGILATLTLSPWLLQIFYTDEFIHALPLLQWFLLGCLGRVVAWPLGFVVLALGRGTLFFILEFGLLALQLMIIATYLPTLGLNSVAVAFVVVAILNIGVEYLVANKFVEFKWEKAAVQLSLASLLVMVGLIVAFQWFLPTKHAALIGLVVTLLSLYLSICGLLARVGASNRFFRWIFLVPGHRFIFPKKLIATNPNE